MFVPIDFNDRRYWEQAKRIKGSDVDAVLCSKGWVCTRFSVWTIYRRPKEEGMQVGVDIPNVVDEFYPGRILDAALMDALFEQRPVADVLDEWYKPQRMRDESANRKKLRLSKLPRLSRKIGLKNRISKRHREEDVLYAKIVPLRREKDGIRVKIVPLSEENDILK